MAQDEYNKVELPAITQLHNQGFIAGIGCGGRVCRESDEGILAGVGL
jgi:hypothetical protein